MNRLSTGIAVRHRSAVILLAATAVISLTGCMASPDVGAGNGPPDSSGGGSSTPASQPAPPVKPESAGSVGPVEQPELPAVDGELDETIKLSTGFTVALDSISATTVKAETPGDVAGPAVEVVVQVTNVSKEPQRVDSAVVTLETDEGDLGIPTIAGGASALKGELAPQESTKGHYLFMLDPAEGRDISISVNYAAGEPVAKFTGRTP
ncbi:hypothetical protein [Leucobacter salsicius]|uniref:hypothetical protein n=1 Tax=Leucobacter salsicius TaxID=664638 RepID=UPI001E2C7257|nr:hypothetical protein [Leucobacter salsicius]